MFIIDYILYGLAVGVVAMLLMPSRDPGGMTLTILATILLGIAGAEVGGFLGRVLGWYGEGDPVGVGLAVLGAILVFFIYRTFRGRPNQEWKDASHDVNTGSPSLSVNVLQRRSP